ncbi:MAG TPA: hypothetical protein PLD46_08860, partial [Hyphomicrobium sp.]|nr:hypothetical protein [Hyphomicrobium sp.]
SKVQQDGVLVEMRSLMHIRNNQAVMLVIKLTNERPDANGANQPPGANISQALSVGAGNGGG